uniref:SFRICE_029534 n=1 Tax=Spodoptera frugiperda TaxID=7108 RepID=A0A2H1WF57_SPOFR
MLVAWVTERKNHLMVNNVRLPCTLATPKELQFTCELTRIENPNEQQLGRKPASHDHLAWSEDPPFLRELYSVFPKYV